MFFYRVVPCPFITSAFLFFLFLPMASHFSSSYFFYYYFLHILNSRFLCFSFSVHFFVVFFSFKMSSAYSYILLITEKSYLFFSCRNISFLFFLYIFIKKKEARTCRPIFHKLISNIIRKAYNVVSLFFYRFYLSSPALPRLFFQYVCPLQY